MGLALLSAPSIFDPILKRAMKRKFGITKSGTVLTVAGTVRSGLGSASDVAYGFTGASGQTGFFGTSGGNFFDMASNGTAVFRFGSNNIQLQSTHEIRWSSSTIGGASDLILARDAANTLALRNGTTAQTFRVYNTFTDASNYERADITWSANVLAIGTSNAGTGTQRAMSLRGSTITMRPNGIDAFTFNSSGHMVAGTDNSYDIGASGATRPRALYVASTGTFGGAISSASGTSAINQVQLTNSLALLWGTDRTRLRSPADGQLTLLNAAETDFSRLQFGGTSSGFPSLKRSSAQLHARLADDSADAVLQALNYNVAGIQVVGAQGAAVADATDAATAITQLNLLLARLRTHGLIAT